MLREPFSLLMLTAGLASLSFLISCENEFARFYKPASADYGTLEVAPATPRLFWSSNPESDAKQLAQAGYVLMGTSSFHAGPYPQREKDAIAQAQKVGAAVVLLKIDWTHTQDFGPGGMTGTTGTGGSVGVNQGSPTQSAIIFASYWAREIDAPPAKIEQVPGHQ